MNIPIFETVRDTLDCESKTPVGYVDLPDEMHDMMVQQDLVLAHGYDDKEEQILFFYPVWSGSYEVRKQ